jgi:toxin ParE1/3/4
MTKVIYSQQAETELVEIGGYIAQDSERHAEEFVAHLRDKANAIAHAPRIYRVRHDLGPELRTAAIRDYVIVFRISRDGVEILHIVHGARDLKRLFED